MSISDFLSFISIAVSIVFGLIFTHFCSIRDTRTRAFKDHYIEQLKAIKGRVGTFFHRVAFGKSSARNIKSWYNHISIDIESVDTSVRKSLDLQISSFGDIIDKYYAEITGWEDYNNQYASPKYHPSTECHQRLLAMKLEIDDWLNDYIEHVNQANCYPIWKVQAARIKRSYLFYKAENKKFSGFRACWERFEKHIWELCISAIMVSAIVYLCLHIEEKNEPDLTKPLNEISQKQDGIINAIKNFEEKYQPVNVQTKSYNNSSFFNASNIDSVQINLYQGKK